MTALIVLDTVVTLLLALLVAGLLRSHAEILRSLHHLGAEYPSLAAGMAPATGLALGRRAVASPNPTGEHGAADVGGTTPEGGAAHVGVGRAGEQTLLVFLSSGCSSCSQFWDALRAGGHRAMVGTRTVCVARDADEESPARLAELAADDVTVVLSSKAWDDYRVPGSPYAVLVRGGAVVGEGVATTWAQLVSLAGEPGPGGTGAGTIDVAGETRADHELAAAGIHPHHPSLHPMPPRRRP